MAKEHLLVVEDEEDILELLRYNLAKEGYRVTGALSGEEALRAARSSPPDLIVLDLMLPGMDGLTVCRELKQDARTREVPIIILTAKGEEADIVAGLELGADDYVTKPFASDELVARVRARLRRPPGGRSLGRIHTFGEVVMDLVARVVLVRGEQAHLTPTEYRLLEIFVENAGLTVRRDDLILVVGGNDATEQALQTHVSRLRRKLADDGDRIKTAWGIGYRLVV